MPKIQSTSCGPLVTRSFRSIYYTITACSETSIDTQLAVVHADSGSAQRINGRCISDFHQTTDCILNDKHGHRHIISVNIIFWQSLSRTTNYHRPEIAIRRTGLLKTIISTTVKQFPETRVECAVAYFRILSNFCYFPQAIFLFVLAQPGGEKPSDGSDIFSCLLFHHLIISGSTGTARRTLSLRRFNQFPSEFLFCFLARLYP